MSKTNGDYFVESIYRFAECIDKDKFLAYSKEGDKYVDLSPDEISENNDDYCLQITTDNSYENEIFLRFYDFGLEVREDNMGGRTVNLITIEYDSDHDKFKEKVKAALDIIGAPDLFVIFK